MKSRHQLLPLFLILFYAVSGNLAGAGNLRTDNMEPEQKDDSFELGIEPCKIEGITVEGIITECGSISVFENRASRTGRKIPIYFVRARARSTDPSPDPIIILAGGPGENATDSANVRINEATTLDRRDLIIVDQRGTGRSNPLDCISYDLKAHPEDFEILFSSGFFEPDRYRECLDRLRHKADLKQYTTSNIADDINDLRIALGYKQLNLDGGSYGTTLGLEILRRHGEHIRTALFRGVIPPNIVQTETLAPDLESALEQLFTACELDQACAGHFPGFRTELKTVLDRVKRQPVQVILPHSVTQEPTEVTLRYDELVTAIRYALYSVNLSSSLPLYTQQAMDGDYAPISGLLPTLLYALSNIVSEGMQMSVRCTNEMPFINEENARRLAKNTVIGEMRIDQQLEICSFWPHSPVPEGYFGAVSSDTPVLLLYGAVDAATPGWMAKKAASALPNGRLLEIANRSHWGLSGSECVERIAKQFFDEGATSNLDIGCTTEFRRPPFALPEK